MCIYLNKTIHLRITACVQMSEQDNTTSACVQMSTIHLHTTACVQMPEQDNTTTACVQMSEQDNTFMHNSTIFIIKMMCQPKLLVFFRGGGGRAGGRGWGGGGSAAQIHPQHPHCSSDTLTDPLPCNHPPLQHFTNCNGCPTKMHSV